MYGQPCFPRCDSGLLTSRFRTWRRDAWIGSVTKSTGSVLRDSRSRGTPLRVSATQAQPHPRGQTYPGSPFGGCRPPKLPCGMSRSAQVEPFGQNLAESRGHRPEGSWGPESSSCGATVWQWKAGHFPPGSTCVPTLPHLSCLPLHGGSPHPHSRCSRTRYRRAPHRNGPDNPASPDSLCGGECMCSPGSQAPEEPCALASYFHKLLHAKYSRGRQGRLGKCF